METYAYVDAVYGANRDFDASPEALAHLAFCNVNSMITHQIEMLRRAREKYRELPMNKNGEYIEICRRKLHVHCQIARMLIAASRAERLGYTECTVNATQEDIERYLDLMSENAALQHELDMQAFDDMRVPHHESCLCAGCAASIEYV